MPLARSRRATLRGAVKCLLVAAICARAQLRVLAPQAVGLESGSIDGSTATFGAPFYGDRVLGRLVYHESRGENYCTEADYDAPRHSQASLRASSSEDGRFINIILVRRGNCSFVTKARVAQNKGAHALVVVDRADSELTSRDLSRIIVADDGYGDAVRIPTVLIAKDEGARLIDAVKNGHQVVVELKWDIPADRVVQLDLWMSSGSARSLKFLKEFAPLRKQLNKVVSFQPHYVVFGMPSTDPGVFRDLCTDTSGEFCAEDPDGSGAVTGRAVLEEDVRQLCIHELSRAKPEQSGGVVYAEKYWDYVQRFGDECPIEGASAGAEASDPAHHFGLACSERVMREVGLDVDAVRSCAETTATRKLQAERRNTAWSPRALRINGWRYSGMVEADLVARAVCSGFHRRPPECEQLLQPRDPFVRYDAALAGSGAAAAGEVRFSTMLTSVGVLLLVLAVAMLLYRRSLRSHVAQQIREEVMLEVSSQMSSYNKLPADL